MSHTATLLSNPFEIADADLCAAACAEIYAQRPLWRARRLNGKRPFYTLGGAAYLDLGFAARPIDEYLADAGSFRRWAGPAVNTIFERVRDALEARLEQRVEYSQAIPAPGFHIFIGAAIPQTDCTRHAADCGSCHFDLQYRLIPWERWFAHIDCKNTISFTLPLNLPSAGGGLTVWESLTADQLRAQLTNKRFETVASAAHATPGTFVPYATGSLVVHGGHVLHQMAGIRACSVTDERLTLQGHGIFADGAWRLYW